MDQATLSRLLDLVNLAAVLEKSRFAGDKETILARMLAFPSAWPCSEIRPSTRNGLHEKEREIWESGAAAPRVHTMKNKSPEPGEFRRKPTTLRSTSS